MLSVGFVALALTIAWFGIRINAWYGGTLGGTAEASSLIAGLSMSADVLALPLPAAARALWVRQPPRRLRGGLGALDRHHDDHSDGDGRVRRAKHR